MQEGVWSNEGGAGEGERRRRRVCHLRQGLGGQERAALHATPLNMTKEQGRDRQAKRGQSSWRGAASAQRLSRRALKSAGYSLITARRSLSCNKA